jgi:hypothetical protein
MRAPTPCRAQVGIEDAIHTALLTLKEGFEGQVSGSNIEARRAARGRRGGGVVVPQEALALRVGLASRPGRGIALLGRSL